MSGQLICGKTTGNAVVPIQCNPDGTLEMTAEIDSSALNKEATQLLVKANTEVGHGAGNNTRGIFYGGGSPSATNTIDFITIATTGDASDFGD